MRFLKSDDASALMVKFALLQSWIREVSSLSKELMRMLLSAIDALQLSNLETGLQRSSECNQTCLHKLTKMLRWWLQVLRVSAAKARSVQLQVLGSWPVGATTEEEQRLTMTPNYCFLSFPFVLAFSRTWLMTKKESKSMKTGETKFNTKEVTK